MKKLTAILLAMCLAACPVACLAEETESYSFLKNMDKEELKALRDTIDEILANGNELESSSETDENKDSLNPVAYDYANELIYDLANSLPDPNSLVLHSVYCQYMENLDDPGTDYRTTYNVFYMWLDAASNNMYGAKEEKSYRAYAYIRDGESWKAFSDIYEIDEKALDALQYDADASYTVYQLNVDRIQREVMAKVNEH